MKKRVIVIACTAVLFAGVVMAEYRHLGVFHYPEHTPRWCGPAVVEMWSDSMKGRYGTSYDDQDWIAKRYNMDDGASSREMEKALEGETGKGFQRRKYRSKKSFNKRAVKKEMQKGRPVATNVNTIYRDKRKGIRPRGHWFLLDGFSSSRSGSKAYKKLRGYKVNDPAYSMRDIVAYVDERWILPKDEFFGIYSNDAAKYRGKRTIVED